MKNAVILAAGKSKRFAPLTYEKPKGLFRVKKEVLIERQICQLREAGIYEIVVVVGYMKEKFFYLEEKYGVILVVNNTFSTAGNLYSLYMAKDYLADTFICCADHYFPKNPFMDGNEDNRSYRACSYRKGKFLEFAIDYSEADVITGFAVGGRDKMAMAGHAYFNRSFSKTFCRYLESEINDFGVCRMYWEEFYARHFKQLTLYKKEFLEEEILEFETIDDLKQFDSEFLFNVDSRIIDNICSILGCSPNQIEKIEVIQAGLTNVSFQFSVGGTQYVYRHPGGTAGQLVDRNAEVYAQKKAIELGIDRSVIYVDVEGWKISYFIAEEQACDFKKNPDQLAAAMAQLRKIHSAEPEAPVKRFHTVKEGKKLMAAAVAAKGNLFEEFSGLIHKIDRLNQYVEQDARMLGIELAVCHNDVYEPNFLAAKDGALYLIDWEYAGLNDPANDLACMFCRGSYTQEQIDDCIASYLCRKPTKEEHRHYMAYIALCGFYWFCWGLYKGSVGDDDGFFFLPAYRSCMCYLDPALNSYENDAVWMRQAQGGQI